MRCISEEDGRNWLRKFTWKSMEIMPHKEHWWARLTDKVSSGRLLLLMQMKSSSNVRDANILLGRYTCRRRSSILSRSLGHLQSGVSTWSALCRERRVVLHISLSPSTNSPNGLKPNLSPRSQLPKQRNSSMTLWSDSAFQTGLSQIMALSSQEHNSKIGVKNSA